MIVDDEAILRTGIIHLCNWSEYGIEIVAQASNGQEALQYIEEVHPHVVITDIVMPVMDGIEFTKTMQTLHPEIKIVVLSSYSEFDYVREVFKYGVTDYLLKPKVSATELISLIQTLCSNVELNTEEYPHTNKRDPSLILGQWLSSDTTGQEDIPHDLQQQFPSDQFIMIKASTNLVLSRTKWTQSQMEQSIMELASRHFSGQAFPCSYTCIFLKNETLLIINYDSHYNEAILASVDRFSIETKNLLTYISFILSNAFTCFDHIKDEHERLTPYLGKLMYFIDQALVPETEISAQHDKVHFDQAHFTTAIRTFAIEEANMQLKALFHDVSSTRTYDEYSLKRLSQNLIYTALSTLEQLKQPITELSSSKLKLFKMIDLAFDIRELEHILLQFLDRLKEIVPSTDQHQSIILQQIYEYVNENYANDISLSEMAGKLHLNYSYLSSYFKQRTNENLTTYINRVRTDRAKELLHNHELSVSEISRITGFSDHNYFSKVFKKMTGMTPLEYRNQI